jgi:hypothetical protein
MQVHGGICWYMNVCRQVHCLSSRSACHWGSARQPCPAAASSPARPAAPPLGARAPAPRAARAAMGWLGEGCPSCPEPLGLGRGGGSGGGAGRRWLQWVGLLPRLSENSGSSSHCFHSVSRGDTTIMRTARQHTSICKTKHEFLNE